MGKRIDRRKHNRDLIAFLGENLGGLWVRNMELYFAKKEAKLFRMCMEWEKA